MTKDKGRKGQLIVNELPLVQGLGQEVRAWSAQGWPGVTQTTAELLAYWFNRDETDGGGFHPCQRLAIETVIYCHEILGITSLQNAYERLASEALTGSAALAKEVAAIPFPKYALKMATGTGKTWVLAALLVWQYFNMLNRERDGKYSSHYMIVAPGHEVLNRLQDMFLGKHDASGNRDKSKSDFERTLFMPEGPRWRNRFHWRILTPDDIRANLTPPDEPFVYLTNWQQFQLGKKPNMWDQLTGADVEEQPRGEVIADFLSEYPDLIVLNDEAHHVHGSKTAAGDELQWRQFMHVLHDRILERHGAARGVFMQLDFSATPFFGSAEHKEYFPHIVYDYGLVEAMGAMLVKQIFLEERGHVAGESIEELRVVAKRGEAENGKRGSVIGLAPDQLTLLQIGQQKLEQLAQEFRKHGLDKKPILFVLTEETEVANLVGEHFAHKTDERGRSYSGQTFIIHSEIRKKMSEEAWKTYREPLEHLDEPEEQNPIRVVVNVTMLQEGFDTRNVCVVVVLRSAKSDLLLEQVVGRGLRLMFPGYDYPVIHEAKREAREDLMQNKPPRNSFDLLFVVEHPQFRSFYEELRAQGYAIGTGDTEGIDGGGDIATVEATPDRIAQFDLAWPTLLYDDAPRVDVCAVNVQGLPMYGASFAELRKYLSKLAITETHAETGGKVSTWKLEHSYFDYNHFLRQASLAVAKERGAQHLTGQLADISALIDDYVRDRLFGETIETSNPEHYVVLNHAQVFDFVVQNIRSAIMTLLGEIHYEVRAGSIAHVSDVMRIQIRESLAVEARQCIYPKLGYTRTGEGFERQFIAQTLNTSSEIDAFAKLQQRKHNLAIAYRDTYGIQRPHYPDFIVKTKDSMYLVETKQEKEYQAAAQDPHHSVALKARAAQSWCRSASRVSMDGQPQEWKYALVREDLFKQNSQLGFEALINLAMVDTERLATIEEGRLV